MMSRRKARELRQLREIAHFFLPQHTCWYCQKPLMVREFEDLGHSTPTPIAGEYTVNHNDGHPNGNKKGKRNNEFSNLSLMHRKCHKSHELKLRHQLRKAAQKGN